MFFNFPAINAQNPACIGYQERSYYKKESYNNDAADDN